MNSIKLNEQAKSQSPVELGIGEAVVQKLSLYGDAKLAYLTAELEPFSSQQKPNIVFKRSDNSEILFVVDFRFSKVNTSYEDYVSFFNLRRDFVLEVISGYKVVYIFGTNEKLTSKQLRDLASSNILAIDEISSADEFADTLIGISENISNTSGK